MKNRLISILALVLCFIMVASILTACSKNKDTDDSTTLAPDDSWSGADDSYEPVDITDVELVAIVSEALGDEADGFTGDLSTLSDTQLEKVKKVAEEKGYILETDNSGDTVIKKESNVEVSEVSSEKASEIFSEANVPESTSLTPEQYSKVSKAAEENGATAVTDKDGDVTIIETTKVPTTARKVTTNVSGTDLYPTATTSGKYVTTTVPSATKNSNNGTARSVTAEAYQTVSIKTTAITAAAGNTFGNKAHVLFNANAATSDGGTVTVGNTFMGANGKVTSTANGIIAKYDSNGNLIWKDILSGNEITKYEDVAVLTDGSIIAVGETLAENLVSDSEYKCKSTVEAIVVKYSADGTRQWIKIVGGSGSEELYAVAPMSDGSFVIGGYSDSQDADFKGVNSNKYFGFVAKMSANGALGWITAQGGSYAADVEDIAVTSENTIYATIVSVCNDGDFKNVEGASSSRRYTVIEKLDSSGAIKWKRSLYDNGNVELDCITAGNSTGCVVAGSYASGSGENSGSFKGIYTGGTTGTTDGMIVKYSATGDVVWKLPLIGFQSDTVTGITAVNGGYAVCGYTTSTNRDFAITNKGDFDTFAAVINEYGALQTINSIGGSDSDRAMDICADSTGTNVFLCGTTLSSDGNFAGCSATSDGTNAVGYVFKMTLTQN